MPSHMRIGDFNPADRKFWGPPELGFSPRRNKSVVEGTIKKYELMRKRKMADFVDKLRERTDAAASFLKSRLVSSNPKAVDRYFGKTYLAHLRGEDIKTQLIKQRMMQVGLSKEKVWKEKQKLNDLKKRVLTGKGAFKVKGVKPNGQKAKKRSSGI